MKRIFTLCFFLLCLTAFSQTYSGTYTIGGINPDFQTIQESIDSLTQRGVSGPVSILINPGIYTEQLHFHNIPGSSGANPVLFSSSVNDSTQVTITFSSSNTNSNYVVRFDSTRFVTLKGVSLIKNDTTFGTLVRIASGNYQLHIQSCLIKGALVHIDSVNTSSIQFINTTVLRQIYFDRNYFLHGSNAIYSSTNTGNDSLYFNNNVFSDQAAHAINLFKITALFFSGNRVSSIFPNAGGIMIDEISGCSCYNIRIEKNYFEFLNIHSWSCSPIVINVCGGIYLINNMINMADVWPCGFGFAALYTDYCSSIYLYNNTIRALNNSMNGYTAIFRLQGYSNYTGEIKNNIFIGQDCGYGYFSGTSMISDYNCFYFTGSNSNVLPVQQSYGQDSNSIYHNPSLYSATDFHTYDIALKHAGTSLLTAFPPVTVDFDNELRDTVNPDIGADEFVYIPQDSSLVWPGDANNDSIVDNNDILAIGLGYTISGICRDTISNNWNGHYCLNWNDSIPSGFNANYADCDGNGIINATDTQAVSLNFFSTHQLPLYNGNQNSVLSTGSISLVPDQNTYFPGDTVTVHMIIGDSISPAVNCYGLSGTLIFNNSNIVPGSFSVSFPLSFFTNNEQNYLPFDRTDFANGNSKFAITRTDHNAVTGYGEIGVIRFIVDPSLQNPSAYTISFSALYGNDNNGQSQSFFSAPAIIYFDTIAGVNSIIYDNDIKIFPVPATDLLSVKMEKGGFGSGIKGLSIFDVYGRELIVPSNQYFLSGNIIRIDLRELNLTSGTYILNIQCGERSLRQSFIFTEY